MTRLPKPSAGIILAITVLAALFWRARYAMALQSGVGHSVALRTYVFWALVCAPVAHLGEIVVRSVLDYRTVRMALTWLKSR